MHTHQTRLYLLTPPKIDPEAFAERLTNALEAGDIACLQLRLKDVADDAIRAAVKTLLPVCHAHDVPLLVNDRPDLAKETGADGVHVGQQDMACAKARDLLGDDAIVGVTCHDSRHLAMLAAEAGADYVAFGAFYPTTTKETKYSPRPEILEWWSESTTLPCVAIGGITPENCAPLVTAGADFLAVLRGVWDDPAGPAEAVRAFNRAIRKAADAPPPPEAA
ncbi:MAG: thiamine phosphate synthase [Alphaproteobacteria bacterium]|nr:thiamine phosphate synthase [Alphaproteobacteria bacterium]